MKRVIKLLISVFFLILVLFSVFWFGKDVAAFRQIYNQTLGDLTGVSSEQLTQRITHLVSGKQIDSYESVKNDTLAEHAARHADPTYVCPMHPQIVRDEPGNCPICGMNLVKKELEPAPEKSPSVPLEAVQNDTLAEHAARHADPTYVCPMHPQIVRDEPGNCPICGMNLVKKEMEPAPEKSPSVPLEAVQNDTLAEHAARHADPTYVCPMHPQIVRDEPGNCPICGMNLVKKEAEKPSGTATSESAHGKSNDYPAIRINATTAQNMGVRIQPVVKKPLARTIRTIGSVTYNEDQLHHVHARASGWVEKVFTQSLGDPVEKGKTLLEFYSPDIVKAQKDLITARRASASLSGRDPASISESSRIRLRDLNVPEQLIEKITRSGQSQRLIPVLANQSGVVSSIGIRNGMFITPGTELYTIADLSSVWVMVDVFEHQMSWVSIGDKAEIEVKGVPGRRWAGKVDYIYPELNPMTRTLKVRLKFATPDQLLKPNMFADVTLYSEQKEVLAVPSDALIYYENGPRIVKVTGTNRYQPVAVKTGMKSGHDVEILGGLSEGDKILVSGQFMIDSESNLQASFRRLSGE